MATFRARARALDMLGRQQIANIPTAVSELFKNAHDAYARRVEVDYFRTERLLVLRDDGVGMTEKEFGDRWLTLGTESKITGPDMELPYVPPGEAKRPLMGEKGIGRLAIASLGSQVLVLTRAKRKNLSDEIVAAFVPWNLFTIPGVDLDAVEIPVTTFRDGGLPSLKDVRDLIASARGTVKRLQRFAPPQLLERLLADFVGFEEIDPRKLDKFFRSVVADTPSLADAGGTHFFVHPTEDTISIDLDGGASPAQTTPPMVKMLIGFTNTLSPDAPTPVMKTAFRDHKATDLVTDVASEKEFFSPEDLAQADHAVSGHFDEEGRFSGKVRVFEKTMKYSLDPIAAKPFLCGPFDLNFGYLQGTARESLLYKKDAESFAELEARLDRIGGLYVYRDGIRILPYGDTDFDFLKVEERRSKGAAYYFFSYRRMFGAIDLSRTHNTYLQEKAGREGFRRNKAYQQFIDSLTNLLVQLAGEFFREGGARADYFQERKEALDKGERLRRERDKLAREKLAQLSERLADALQRLERGGAQKDLKAIVRALEAGLEEARARKDPEAASGMVDAAEKAALHKLDELRSGLRVEKPRGIALPAGTKRDWAAYLDLVQAFEREALAPARERIEVAIAEAFREVRGSGRRLKRARAAIAEAIEAARKSLNTSRTAVKASEETLQEKVHSLVQESIDDLEHAVSEALAKIAELDPKTLDDPTFARKRIALEETIAAVAERRVVALRRVCDVIAGVSAAIGSDAPAPDEMTEALEEELLALRERADTDLQLTQLGMAIEIINHEFSASIRTVRGAIKRLKAWGDKNPNLASVYTDLRTSFDHLDGYLRLFTPLHRRLYRNAVQIRGGDIAQYLGDLFKERLRRHGVDLRATKTFRDHEFTGYPSTFYPVFVNLVDNAIFWLSDRKGDRFIELDFDGKSMIVSDNGPGIPERDSHAVFAMGFTRKPGGRGLGLFISREVLRKAGYAIELAAPRHEHGATFVIAERGPDAAG